MSETPKLILASGSPRRRQLLEQIGLCDFTVHPAQIQETVEPGLAPGQVVMSLSAQKAQAVAAQFPGDLVLAADTVVAFEDAILGKPRDPQEAEAMLKLLSGRAHHVFTGLTLQLGDRTLTDCERTQVMFRPLEDAEIRAYVATGEPMDKAGGYGIQGPAALFVAGIRGDYSNVMGLPLCRLGGMLRVFGLDPLGGAAKG